MALQDMYRGITVIGIQNISTPFQTARGEAEFHLGEEPVAGSEAVSREIKARSAQKASGAGGSSRYDESPECE